MVKQIPLAILAAVLMLTVFAGPARPQSPAPDAPVILLAGVEQFDIVVMETQPVQVRIAVYGWMSDACTSIRDFKQVRDGRTIYLKIYTTRPLEALCAQVIKRFRKTFPLDTAGLSSGSYTLDVSGKRKEFKLP